MGRGGGGGGGAVVGSGPPSIFRLMVKADAAAPRLIGIDEIRLIQTETSLFAPLSKARVLK